MKIIQITEDKIGKMSDCVEKMLHYGGRLMSCIEELESGGSRYGERDEPMWNRYGNRYGQRGDMGYRDDDDMDEIPMPSRYGQRGRRRDSYGRFM